MPASTQYKALTIRNTSYSVYQSVIFGALLAQLGDAEKLVELFSKLFGDEKMMAKFSRLQSELNHYQQTGDFPGSLLGLIQEHFLPRFANHLRKNGRTFLHVSVVEQIESSAQGIEQGRIDAIVQQALAHLLQVSIYIYSQSAGHLCLNTRIGDHSLTLFVLEDGEIYRPLINVSDIKEAQQSAFNALPMLTFQAEQSGLNTIETFNEQALKSLVQEILTALPVYLATISAGVPPAPVLNPMLASTQLSLTRVDSVPPDLALRNLGDGQDDLTAVRLAYESSVVLFAGDSVESIWTWAGSLTTTLITGMTGGTVGLGLAAGVAEGITVATGGALGAGCVAVSVAFVPAFVACTLLTLIGGAVGKTYAQEYKQALQNANQHINAGRYERAAEVLEEEFNRWGIVRVLRRSFLTKAHFAVAHLFRGLCAENMDDLPKAYTEYQKALADAKDADAKIVTLLLHVKVIQFLRMHSQILNLPPEQRVDVLIRMHLDALNHYFKDSLTHLYWQAHNSMIIMATDCSRRTPFSRERLAWAQGVLDIKSLFILDGYHGGHGNYQQVLYSFFQALTIAYLHFNDQQVIRDCRLLQPVDEDDSIKYVLRKLTEAFTQFNTFRTAYPILADQPAFRQCHNMMKEFTLRFGTILKKLRGTVNRNSYKAFINNLPALVGVPIHEVNLIASRHEQSIQFLMSLEAEFGLHFETIKAWLKKLSDPRQQCHTVVNQRSQMNMLHMLTKLPAGLASEPLVRLAADRMKDMIYARNNEHQTALSLLEQVDAYGIKAGIQGPKLISLGTGLNEVDTFIAGVERNVGGEGHFLLLQGPAGTGKTEAVVTHLRSKNHVIFEWESGAADDKWVGQINRRVIDFFQLATKSARQAHSPRATVLFIDEMSGVCPEVNGDVQNGRHNQAAVVDEFQKQISALKGHNVILVGATNFPWKLSKAIQNRATRVIFPLPDRVARTKLLSHLFRFKCISEELIRRLVDLTEGWSPRQLTFIVEQVKGHSVSVVEMEKALDKSAESAQEDFRKDFVCSRLMLPRLKIPAADPMLIPVGEVANVFSALKRSLVRPELFRGVRMHTLLYGPPGSGKTTAIREFANQSNCPFILIESGCSIADMIGIFDRAKAYTSAIICIDEIDRVTQDGNPKKEFLQEQMDGFLANNIIIVGATNYPHLIATPVFSRFSLKAAVPSPTPEERGLFIQQRIMAKATNFQPEPMLQREMAQGCVELGRLSEGLSYRDLTNAFDILFPGLIIEQQMAPSVLRLENIIGCINSARQTTQRAVVAQAQEMAAQAGGDPRFFREPANNAAAGLARPAVQFA
jgi:SpoVK/Ycf46/Vps4 family AAA+-type ATPase